MRFPILTLIFLAGVSCLESPSASKPGEARSALPPVAPQLPPPAAASSELPEPPSPPSIVWPFPVAQAPTPDPPPRALASVGGPARPRGVDATKTLQKSTLKLLPAELALIQKNGFVVVHRRRYDTFADGWLDVYKADLPLFVTADALLHAVHRSYDAVLRQLENRVLVPRLESMLLGMRARLGGPEGAALFASTLSDVDLFTAVALQLLKPQQPVTPVVPTNGKAIDEIVALAKQAGPLGSYPVFGSWRHVDWSQFKPRGHYTTELADYFRAMIWLGRTEVTIANAADEGYVLDRRQLALACALRAVMGTPEMAALAQLEATMNTFVGQRDAMSPLDVDHLLADLGIHGPSELPSAGDAKIFTALDQGHYADQRILSQFAWEGKEGPRPLTKAFSFAGQRYTPDAHAFSDLVDDRVPLRLMPNPLDIAYAVLADDGAKKLLAPDVTAYPQYGPALERLRTRFDSGGAAFWDSSLYELWLDAARALSPGRGVHLPPAVKSEAWGRRILSSQLASWAELRRDTILYVKQSYTSGILCSYPDAYVDPYPKFYERLVRFADRGRELVKALDFGPATDLQDRVDHYFQNLGKIADRLRTIAESQARTTKLSKDDIAFINDAIVENPRGGGCGGPTPRTVHGWYADLFFAGDALECHPTIADVHTQPTDGGGNMVGRVLHVATAQPRLIVVNVGDGANPHPYFGLVSTYVEKVTDGFRRETDEEWKPEAASDTLDDVPWIRDLVAR